MDSSSIERRINRMNDLEEDRIRATTICRLSFMHQRLKNDPTAGDFANHHAASSPHPSAQNVSAAVVTPQVRFQSDATSRQHLEQMLQEAMSTPMGIGSVGQQAAAERKATQKSEDSEEKNCYKSSLPLKYRSQSLSYGSKDKLAGDGENDVKEDDSKGEGGLCRSLLSCVTGGRKVNKRESET